MQRRCLVPPWQHRSTSSQCTLEHEAAAAAAVVRQAVCCNGTRVADILSATCVVLATIVVLFAAFILSARRSSSSRSWAGGTLLCWQSCLLLPQLWEQAARWDAFRDPADATIQAYSKHSHIAAAVHSSDLTLGPRSAGPRSITGSLDRPAHLGLIHRSWRDSGRRMMSALARPDSYNGDTDRGGGDSIDGCGTTAV